MTIRERRLLQILGLVFGAAVTLAIVSIVGSEAGSRERAIATANSRKQALQDSLVLTPKQRVRLEQFVRDTPVPGSADEQLVSRVLASSGLEVQSFRVTGTDASVQFEVKGEAGDVLAALRSVEVAGPGLRFRNTQLVRIRANEFSWRGTVDLSQPMLSGGAEDIVEQVAKVAGTGGEQTDSSKLAGHFRRKAAAEPGTASASGGGVRAQSPNFQIHAGIEFIGLANSGGGPVYLFRDSDRNAVFAVRPGAAWLGRRLVEATADGFLFEIDGGRYRVNF